MECLAAIRRAGIPIRKCAAIQRAQGKSGARAVFSKTVAARGEGQPLDCGGKRQRHAAFGVLCEGGPQVNPTQVIPKGGVALSLATAVQGQAAAASLLKLF